MKKYLVILYSILFFFFSFNKGQAQDIVLNGANTKPINFPSGPCVYTWTNNNTSIGLAANGTGNIPSFTAVNTGGTPVTATIIGTPVGTGFAYIVNSGSNSVSVINTATSAVVANIAVGSNPNSVCVDPNYNEVYVVNNSSNTVSVINTLTNTVKATVSVGPGPWSVTVSPDGSLAYVADGGNNDVEVINTTTNTIVATIPAGSNPNALAVSPDGSLIYVNNANSVMVINTSTYAVVANIPVGSLPQAILITPDGSKVYEANYLSNDVYVINTATNTVAGVIPIGVNPGGGSMSPDGSMVYIANEGSNSVSVISTATNTVIKTIPVGGSPWGVSVRPDGSQIYVANSGSNSISVINASTNAIISSIAVGSAPYSFGSFFTGGMGCSALVKFTITVNPTLPASPTITATTATGTISACAGTASASPNVQQFTVSGSGLTGSITATAPAGFEVSLAVGSGYGSSVTIPQTSGAVSNTVVYVRSAAAAPTGSISGNITLTSAGASNQTVAVTGTVNALPTVNAVANQTVNNGVATAAVNFAGTGNTFTWVNNTPGISLAASGSGNIASFTAVNMGNGPVTATITATPITGGFAYIPNSGDGTVSVVNTAANTVQATIQVGAFPFAVAASADGRRVYITNEYSNSVSVINTADNTVIATVAVGSYPDGAAVSPDGTRVYITNNSDNLPNLANTVSVINTLTNSVVSTVTVGPNPLGVSVSPDGAFVYVANSFSNTVSVIQTATNTISATITVGLHPFGVCFSPDGSRAYVTNHDEQSVSVINTATKTVIATVSVGMNPYGICSSPDGLHLYVANLGGNSVSVINTASNTVTSTIPVGALPYGICVSPDGNSVYVPIRGTNSISTINTTTNAVSGNTIVGSMPYSFGNFVTNGTGCAGIPTTFTITVNPTLPASPTITASTATGTISACAGTASASPNVQQFTVSGGGLNGNITATAPTGFEISLAAGSGYGNNLTLIQTGGTISSTIVYVRSAASAASGSISGNVVLTSPGATSQNVAVTGTVNALPTVNAVANQTVNNGTATTAINFTGTGGTFNWVNNTPGIGLAASGTGDIASFIGVNTGNVQVKATITVTPTTTGFAYITNAGDGTVSVINTSTNAVVATIQVGIYPFGVATSQDGSRVYIADEGPNDVLVISTATNSILSTIPIPAGTGLFGICVSPDGRLLYAANEYSNTVTVVNTSTNAVVSTIPVGTFPDGITASPDGNRVYVANQSSNTVSVINTATNIVISTIPVGLGPFGISVSPDGSYVYVANQNSNTVSVINTATDIVSATINVGLSPHGISVSPDGSHVYVANGESNSVSVINAATNSVIATIPVSSSADPIGISVSADGSQVYVANYDANTVTVISTATNAVTSTIITGPGPGSLGNFIAAGSGCSGIPVTFTITVNPTSPTITATVATGTISACAGAASASPNIQQFTVSGSGLTGNITATAPTGFELSLAAGSGYGSSIDLVQAGGSVSNTVVYVRSAASLPNGAATANVLLSSPGAPGQTVSVTGIVSPVVPGSLVISASGNNICAGTPVTFTATPNNGSSSPIYQWLLNGSIAGTNSPTFSSNTFANGDLVSCVMTSSSACVTPSNATSNSITMNVNADVVPSISIVVSQNPICAGAMITFTAMPINGGGSPFYQWLVNGNIAGTNSATFSTGNFANGDKVDCVMTSSTGCATPTSVTSNTINMSLSLVVTPAIAIAASQNNICPGANVTFTATPTNGGSSPVYQWLLNGNNIGTNSPTFASSTLSNGDLISCQLTSNTICLTTPNGASNTITMIINAQVIPTVSISISANNVCAGTPVTFTANPTNGDNPPVYQWLLNGNNAGTNSPTFTSSTFANGDVVSCIVTSSLACSMPASVTSNSIITNIFPLPVVKGGGNKTIEKGSSVALIAMAWGNIADITWSPSTGLDNNKILTPQASPALTTLYTITVQTAGGCMAVDSVTVTVFDGISIPNTFTPNGDGVNDKWDIQNLKDYKNCVVRIFDRYGGEVYSSKGYYNAWDGTIKGQRLPVGTYYYLINLNDGTRPLSGFVALIR